MSAVVETELLRFDHFGDESRMCASEMDSVVHLVLEMIRQQILEQRQDSFRVLSTIYTTLKREVERHHAFIEEHPKRYNESDEELASEAVRQELVGFWGRIEAYALIGRWAVCAEANRVENGASEEIQ